MVQEAFVRAEELLVPPNEGLGSSSGREMLPDREGDTQKVTRRPSVERGIAHRTSLPDPGTMRCLMKLVPEQNEQLKTLAAQDASAKLERAR